MKNKKIFTILLCLVLMLCMCACTKKDNENSPLPATSSDEYERTQYISGTKAHVTPEFWEQTADLILKGKVIEIKDPYYTNPDGMKMESDGKTPILNALATEYVVAVEEVYKGTWEEKTITVQINNRLWSPTDGKTKFVTDMEDVTMEKGDCLLGLCLFEEETFGKAPFYELCYGAAGYFRPERDGQYRNAATDINNFTIDPAQLKK